MRKRKRKNWIDEDVNIAITMINDGNNFKEIAKTLKRSQAVVTKKLHKLGYKSPYVNGGNKGETKYINYNWVNIQKAYDNGLSFKELQKPFKISINGLTWGVNNGKLKTRSKIDGLKLAWKKGKYKESNKEGIDRYRQLCEFKFSLNDYPDKFDFKLIEQYGWYRAKNRGDNLNGISRDHMYSIKDGFINNIEPYYLSHPANCKLMRHNENSKKKNNSSIKLEELIERVNNWK